MAKLINEENLIFLKLDCSIPLAKSNPYTTPTPNPPCDNNTTPINSNKSNNGGKKEKPKNKDEKQKEKTKKNLYNEILNKNTKIHEDNKISITQQKVENTTSSYSNNQNEDIKIITNSQDEDKNYIIENKISTSILTGNNNNSIPVNSPNRTTNKYDHINDDFSILNQDHNYQQENEQYYSEEEKSILNQYEKIKNDIQFYKEHLISEYSEFRYDDQNKDSIVHISSLEEFSNNYHDHIIRQKILNFSNKYNIYGVRGVRGDGNCLYRSYLFSFLDIIFKLIIDGDRIGIIYLKMLIIHIYFSKYDENKYQYFRDHFYHNGIYINDAKKSCLSVLKFIIESFDENKLDKAFLYKLFLINFAKNLLFENYLVCWIRSYVENYLENKSTDLYDYNSIPLYLYIDNIKDIDKDYKAYLNKNILKYGEEGETLITMIFPFLFGVNGQIINITKSMDNKNFDEYESKFDAKCCLKYMSKEQEYLCNELIKRNITIYVFHRENHFDILYDEKMYNWVKSIEDTIFELG